MRIGLFHGYELTGSGSNEYNRYLSRELARAGHDVRLFCREPRPETIEHVGRAFAPDGSLLFERTVEGACELHQLPHASVRPVYLTDKQRTGNVKAFTALSAAELREVHETIVDGLRAALARAPVDVLHANHLVWQPVAAAETGVPYVVFPHGSSIEYTVRADPRFHAAARRGLASAAGLISGSREVLRRILDLYPDDAEAIEAKSTIVGVGVDTSLFAPVARGARTASIENVRGPFGGKADAQEAEYRASLDRGDFAAVGRYADAYDHAAPDAGLAEKLARVPWDDGRVLLFVGALTAGKGLQAAIAALPRVLEEHPDTHLVVVGSGAYREVLEALVHAIATGNQALFDHLARRGFDLDRSELEGGWPDVGGALPHLSSFAEHVHFLGRLDHDRLRHVFPCADLAIFPSVVAEAYPLVLMESLSNGVLPLVSDFGGFADGLDVLRDLLPPSLVDAMRLPVLPIERVTGIADRISRLLDDPPVDMTVSPSGELRRIAVAHFDWSVCARGMEAAYLRFRR